MMMCQKRERALAPNVAAACSNEGSMPVRCDSVSKKAKGNPDRINDNITPV